MSNSVFICISVSVTTSKSITFLGFFPHISLGYDFKYCFQYHQGSAGKIFHVITSGSQTSGDNSGSCVEMNISNNCI